MAILISLDSATSDNLKANLAEKIVFAEDDEPDRA